MQIKGSETGNVCMPNGVTNRYCTTPAEVRQQIQLKLRVKINASLILIQSIQNEEKILIDNTCLTANTTPMGMYQREMYAKFASDPHIHWGFTNIRSGEIRLHVLCRSFKRQITDWAQTHLFLFNPFPQCMVSTYTPFHKLYSFASLTIIC